VRRRTGDRWKIASDAHIVIWDILREKHTCTVFSPFLISELRCKLSKSSEDLLASL
jgi:hypothetical protein